MVACLACTMYYDEVVILGRADPMSLQERIDALKDKHRSLELAIDEENRRPRPDDIEIARLKKQKLMIKDEIANLMQHH
jgi:hypothetical protein